MLNRPAIATLIVAGALITGCSSSGSTPSSSPTGGTSTSPAGQTGSPSPHGSSSATASTSGKPSSGTSTAPSNPAITSVDNHIDAEGAIISKLSSTPASKQSALITKAFKELAAAAHELRGGIHGVPSSLTQKFVADLEAALSQESRDKQCVATHSKSLCASVTKTSTRQFAAIAADRKKLDRYQG